MSEIEKMYENAGIKKLLYCDICKAQEHALGLCAETKCEPFYPPFTAVKQLNTIKWLMKNRKAYQYDTYNDTYWFIIDDDRECKKYRKFDEALAELINLFWQDLTEEEKQQVKGILE